jgi:hypothetical protein
MFSGTQRSHTFTLTYNSYQPSIYTEELFSDSWLYNLACTVTSSHLCVCECVVLASAIRRGTFPVELFLPAMPMTEHSNLVFNWNATE